MKRSLILFASFALMALVGTAGMAANKPVIDGVVKDGEYSYSQDFGQLQLYLNRTADTLSIAVVGNTKGWVAAGLSESLKMDGATIFMGFVTDDGTVQLKPQAGSGHSHADTEKAVSDTIVSSAMKEAAGKTTLEIALKPAGYIKDGQKTLNMIYAMGAQDSFSPRHTLRGAVSVNLQ